MNRAPRTDDPMAARIRRLAERADAEGLLDVAYATADSPLGEVLVAATRRGLVRVALPNENADEALADIAARLSPRIIEHPARLDEARRELEQYFGGRRHEFELPLDWQLSSEGFRRKVLRATARIPYGETTTYLEMAVAAGSPNAYRAAGTALGKNPIPIVVPCHRVLQSGGKIGNYGGGPAMKEYLLRLEGAL